MHVLSRIQLLHMAEEDDIIGRADYKNHALLRHRDEINDFKALPDMLTLVLEGACHGINPKDNVVPLGTLCRYKELLVELLAYEHFKLYALLLISQKQVCHPGNLEVVPVGTARAYLAPANGWFGHSFTALGSLASSSRLARVWRTSSL